MKTFKTSFLTLLGTICLCCSLCLFPASAEAVVDFESLAQKAVQYDYSSYQQGQALDAFDVWVLEKAGAQLSSWEYDDSDIMTASLAMMEEILAYPDKQSLDYFGNDAYSYSSKQIASLNLLARSWGEDEKAAALLQVLQNRQNQALNGSIDDNPFGDISAFEYLALSGDLKQMNCILASDYIINSSDPDTGAWTSAWNDVMATTQAIRTLEEMKSLCSEKTEEIDTATSKALGWLRNLQKDDGSFQDSAGFDDPLLDSVEVLLTLQSMEINPGSWSSAKGNTILDYLQNEALNADGSLGATGNISDASWLLNACLSLGAGVPADTPLGLFVNPGKAQIQRNESIHFTAWLKLFNGLQNDISSNVDWLVADNSIASISGGLVQAVNTGETKIIASVNAHSASAILSVRPQSGSGGGLGTESSLVMVNIAVVGKDGSLLFGPGAIEISAKDSFGLTAIGALNKTGLSWSFSERFDGFIEEIAGERNQGMSGWMYSLNAKVPGISASEQIVSAGDRVIFWYSQDASAASPQWELLGSDPISKTEVKEKTPDEEKKLPEIKPELERAVPTPVVRVYFDDVDDSIAWARDAIEILAGRGIIQGRGEHFDPLASLTRAEFITLIAQALGNNNNAYPGIIPADVSPSDWFYPSLQFCLQAGIIAGYPDGSFQPGNVISRQEMACILYRLMKHKQNNNLPAVSIEDQENISSWALNAVKTAVAEELMLGYEDGSFRPEQACNRAEAAVILFRYLNNIEAIA